MKKNIFLKKTKNRSVRLTMQGGVPHNTPNIEVCITFSDESGDDWRNRLRTTCRPAGNGLWNCSRYHF
jgi:hypothetical protein